MKTILTSIIFVFVSVQFWGQSTYFKDSTKWIEFYHTAEPYGEYFHDYTSVKRIQGDTIIGNIQYKKVYSKKLKYDYYLPSNPSNPDYNFVGGTTVYNDDLFTYVRQDLLKVYYNVNGIDSLLYDFNIQVGDTITNSNVTMLNENESYKVDSITDFYVQNELRHIFHVHSIGSWTWESNTYSYLIEGIGTYGGILASLRVDFEWDSYDLSCYAIQDVNYFNTLNLNSTIQECAYNLGLKKLSNEVSFTVAPNPSASFVDLELPSDFSVKQIVVTDLSGRIQDIKLQDEINKKRIDLENVNSGVYILKITTSNNQIIESKIIKI